MVNGSESDVVKVISGVPQGSVLDPLLFLIYVNDLCNITLSHGSKVTMYADNLVLYKVIDTESAPFLSARRYQQHSSMGQEQPDDFELLKMQNHASISQTPLFVSVVTIVP